MILKLNPNSKSIQKSTTRAIKKLEGDEFEEKVTITYSKNKNCLVDFINSVDNSLDENDEQAGLDLALADYYRKAIDTGSAELLLEKSSGASASFKAKGVEERLKRG